jgi:hypothetical protein
MDMHQVILTHTIIECDMCAVGFAILLLLFLFRTQPHSMIYKMI